AAPNIPNDHDTDQDPVDPKESAEQAGVVGQPIVVNIAGEPAVIALFISYSANLRTKSGKILNIGRNYYVEAVGARTGKRLWRTVLDVPEIANQYFAELIKL